MRKKGAQPIPVRAEVYSVLTIGVPAGEQGLTATVRATELLREHGFGAGVLAEAIGADATLAIRDVINSTATAVKAELAAKQADQPEGAEAQ